MIKEELRLFTAEELKNLDKDINPPQWAAARSGIGCGVWFVGLFAACMLGLFLESMALRAGFSRTNDFRNIFLGTIGVSVVGLFGLGQFLKWLDLKRARADWNEVELQKKRDLEDGHARITTINAKAALTAEVDEDVGFAGILDVGDGQLVYLCPQLIDDLMLDEDEAGPRFPNTKVVVAQRNASGIVLNLECIGEYLEPVQEIDIDYDGEQDPRACAIQDLYALGSDFLVFRGSFETIAEDIKRLSALKA